MLKNQEFDQNIDQAAQRLLDGGLVAFPTETVYGLGADAENPEAIARIYKVKQRPANHPLIVHLAPNADLTYWTDTVLPYAQPLIDAFWPGPLTLIVPRAGHIPSAVSGGQPTIGLRCPSHPVARALLTRFATLKSSGHGGVAAPSANKFGNVSPTRADHVRSEFPELTSTELLILDGEPALVGIESTIIDISDGAVPVMLRPGHISADQIGRILGVMPVQPHATSPQVSGSLKAHYAPRTPLRLIPSHELSVAVQRSSEASGARVAALVFHVPTDADAMSPAVDYYPCERDVDAYARDLYAILRRLDQQGYAALLIEQPPETPEWGAVNDRLSRAAAAFSQHAVRDKPDR